MRCIKQYNAIVQPLTKNKTKMHHTMQITFKKRLKKTGLQWVHHMPDTYHIPDIHHTLDTYHMRVTYHIYKIHSIDRTLAICQTNLINQLPIISECLLVLSFIFIKDSTIFVIWIFIPYSLFHSDEIHYTSDIF